MLVCFFSVSTFLFPFHHLIKPLLFFIKMCAAALLLSNFSPLYFDFLPLCITLEIATVLPFFNVQSAKIFHPFFLSNSITTYLMPILLSQFIYLTCLIIKNLYSFMQTKTLCRYMQNTYIGSSFFLYCFLLFESAGL